MEVRITFDTEKENLEDLKKLVLSLQDLIKKREKAVTYSNPLATSNIKTPSQVKLESNNPKPQIETQQQTSGFTSGGGRVIPYDSEVSNSLSKIL